MFNLGWYQTSGDNHVGFQFPTNAGSGGNVAPLSAFEAADLRIYRAAEGAAFSATQRSSANGITITSPFDTLTGYHDVDIDLGDNTDAGFYANGYRYIVTLAPDTETIDGETITGVPLAFFRIGTPPANITQVSDDTTAADNLESILDGTDDDIDLLEFLRGGNAMLIGDADGLDASTRTFRNKGDTKDVVVWTITSSSRTAVRDLT